MLRLSSIAGEISKFEAFTRRFQALRRDQSEIFEAASLSKGVSLGLGRVLSRTQRPLSVQSFRLETRAPNASILLIASPGTLITVDHPDELI
jgi:hypothetical protein